ncbi:Hypothetical protein NTJ_07778 [Nesidiocoris tenuis]|uniref:Uncharacterized protein n=1 Tax=Nesidiocoris tenuis TaxID=355587 RepID=A0ABN7ATZ0_9HEMI|nr:Hypothetical protein NTJ_07778 [Nesidiocoris tenuis]
MVRDSGREKEENIILSPSQADVKFPLWLCRTRLITAHCSNLTDDLTSTFFPFHRPSPLPEARYHNLGLASLLEPPSN